MVYLKIIEIVILTLLPTFLWLQFFKSKDYNQEPNYILRRIFILSFLFTPLVGLFQFCTNENLKTALGYFSFLNFNCSFINKSFFSLDMPFVIIVMFFIAAAIEESYKFFTMRLSLWGKAKEEFDEPVDAMVYLITAALGFSAAENLLYALDIAFKNDFLVEDSFLNYQFEIIGFIFMRSLFSTFLHILASGIFGYFFAKAYFHFKNTRFYYAKSILVGLMFSTLIHTNFNLNTQLTFSQDEITNYSIKIFLLLLLLFFSYIIVDKEFKKLQKNN